MYKKGGASSATVREEVWRRTDDDGDRESGGLSRVQKRTAQLRKRGQGSVATATLKSRCVQTMSSD